MGALTTSPAELVRFALERLPAMQLADGAFCHQVAMPDQRPEGRSLRYTLIVTLGLLRAEAAGTAHPFDCDRLLALVRDELDSDTLRAGDLGLFLWAAARRGEGPATTVVDRLRSRLAAQRGWARLDGMEVSWIVIGLLESLAVDQDEGAAALLDEALDEQLRRAESASGLFLHRGSGTRADFPNFATQAYGILACARAGSGARGAEALAAGTSAAEALVGMQRPDGGWPWLHDAQRGVVVEPYEIYSVHQDAMAPMALFALSDATGRIRYREAAVAGLPWIGGDNDLGVPMLDVAAGVMYRSIRRRRPLHRIVLYLNAATAYAARPVIPRARGPLELNPTDRPDHLGWVLEAWADRLR